MTHHLDPVRDAGHGRLDQTVPWIAVLLLVLLLAFIVAILAPPHMAVPPVVGRAEVIISSAENPELSSFARYQTELSVQTRAALLNSNPEVNTFSHYRSQQIESDADLLSANPELISFRNYQAR